VTADLLDLDSDAVRRDPYPVYARLRRERPVVEVAHRGWRAVSRYADVRLVLERADLFSSSVMRVADRVLLGADPPEHTRARRLVNRVFARARSLDGLIREKADALAGEAVARGRCDFVGDFASRLPLGVIAGLLGLDAPLADLARWSRSTIPRPDAGPPDPEVLRSARECDGAFARLVESRRHAPAADDLVGGLLAEAAGDERLTSGEVQSVAKLLFLGGSETTANLLGNALLALLRRPDLLQRVRADPEAGEAAVDETLRFDAPVQVVLRRARADVEIAGTVLPGGSVVAALVGSANRDESVFEDPDAFRLDRPARGHLAFGAGAHRCLGEDLARREAAIGLGAFLGRARSLVPAEDLDLVEPTPSLQLRGPARLLLDVS